MENCALQPVDYKSLKYRDIERAGSNRAIDNRECSQDLTLFAEEASFGAP